MNPGEAEHHQGVAGGVHTVAKLVGLRHGASAYSYLRDLEDWGYLRRIKTIPHPDRKFVKDAAKALHRPGLKLPFLADLIIRQIVIRPGEDEADNAAKILAANRIDEDHPIEAPDKNPEGKNSPRA